MGRRIILSALVVALLGSLSSASSAQQVQHPDLLDLDGNNHGRLDSAGNAANVLFFVMTDCPVSNQYSPEIGRICSDYREKNVGCYLIFVDPGATPAGIRSHLDDYSLDCCPTIIDQDRRLVKLSGASVTPEAVLFSPRGEVLYRGRINDLYAALGKPRRQVRVHDLRNALDEVLAGKTVSNPQTQAVGCYIPQKSVASSR